MMAIAIQDGAASQAWIEQSSEFTLAVPGPSLLQAVIYCGTKSARDVDKVADLKLEFEEIAGIATPGLVGAIGNVALSKAGHMRTGDHLLVVGRVSRFLVNKDAREKPLVSIGPDTDGYELLAHVGQHRIATVANRK
jgi:flavin reductase (DIM6/NTAB) family NADH-FMN oxidoreductase RutF